MNPTMSNEPKERREFGSLRLRGRIWWLRYRIDGKEHWESSRSTSRRVALKLLQERAAEFRADVFTAPSSRRVGFADLERMILDHYKVEGLRSTRRVTSALAHLRETFGPMRAASITADLVTSYKAARLDEGASMSTANYELSVLRKALNLAIDANRLSTRPKISTPKVDNARAGFFEPDDFAAVLTYLRPPLRPVMRFAYLTGWRVPSEILRLTWDRVDFAAGVVSLEAKQTKGKKPRQFPFSALPELQSLLEEQRAATTTLERTLGAIIPYVFHHRGGKPIVSYDGAWRSACRLAATDGKTGAVAPIIRPRVLNRIAHDFRRTAVRNLVRAGVDESLAMKLTGHATREIFDRYNITNDADLRAGVAKLDEYLNPKSKRRGRPKGTTGGQSTLRIISGGGS